MDDAETRMHMGLEVHEDTRAVLIQLDCTTVGPIVYIVDSINVLSCLQIFLFFRDNRLAWNRPETKLVSNTSHLMRSKMWLEDVHVRSI